MNKETNLEHMVALMSSGLSSEAKIRMLRALYTTLCDYMTETGYKVTRDHTIEVASEEMERFFKSKKGAYAAYKMFQMVGSLAAEPSEIKEQIEDMEEEMSADFSRN